MRSSSGARREWTWRKQASARTSECRTTSEWALRRVARAQRAGSRPDVKCRRRFQRAVHDAKSKPSHLRSASARTRSNAMPPSAPSAGGQRVERRRARESSTAASGNEGAKNWTFMRCRLPHRVATTAEGLVGECPAWTRRSGSSPARSPCPPPRRSHPPSAAARVALLPPGGSDVSGDRPARDASRCAWRSWPRRPSRG